MDDTQIAAVVAQARAGAICRGALVLVREAKCLLVLNKGGNHFVQVFLTDTLSFLAFRFHQPLNLDLELSAFLVKAHIGLLGVI